MLLHCEHGFPRQAQFMERFTARARDRIAAFPGYEIKGPQGCSVREVQVPLAATTGATIDALLTELGRLRELTPLIDQTISECLGENEPAAGVQLEDRSGGGAEEAAAEGAGTST